MSISLGNWYVFIDFYFLIKSFKSLEQMKKVRIINIRTEESEEYWRKWILGEVFLFSRAVLFVCLVYHSHFKIDTFFLLSEEISFIPWVERQKSGKVLRKRYEDEICVFFFCVEGKENFESFFIQFTCEMMYKKVSKVLITRRSELFCMLSWHDSCQRYSA